MQQFVYFSKVYCSPTSSSSNRELYCTTSYFSNVIQFCFLYLNFFQGLLLFILYLLWLPSATSRKNTKITGLMTATLCSVVFDSSDTYFDFENNLNPQYHLFSVVFIIFISSRLLFVLFISKICVFENLYPPPFPIFFAIVLSRDLYSFICSSNVLTIFFISSLVQVFTPQLI